MKNWGYIRKNLKTNAKMSLSQNLPLCLKVAAAILLGQVFISWIAGLVSVPLELKLDQVKPIHSLVSMFAQAGPAALAIEALLELAGLFLLAPLELGASGLYLKIVRKQGQGTEKIAFKDAFGWYLRFGRAIKAFALMLSVRLLSAFWGVLFCAVPAVLTYRLEEGVNTADIAQLPSSYMGGMSGAALLLCLGSVFALLRIFAYIAAPYLMAQDPEMGIGKALSQSVRLMRGHLWEYLLLELSFIPWYLLSLLTFGLSLLYFLPYRSACQAVFVRKRQFELLAEQNAAKADGGSGDEAQS